MKHEPWVYGNRAGVAVLLLTLPVVIARHVLLLGPGWNYYCLASLVAWALGPPLWFAWERRWHIKHGASPERIAELEADQRVAQSIWAGVSVLIGALYLEIIRGNAP